MDFKPYKRLVASILIQGIRDIKAYPHPDLTKHYKKNTKPSDAKEAYKFFKADNYWFQYYCGLLEIDSEAFLEKLYNHIKYGKLTRLHIGEFK